MFLIILIAVSLFFLEYAWLLRLSASTKTETDNLPPIWYTTLPTITLGFIGCLCSYFLIPEQQDAVIPLTCWHQIIFFLSAFGILFLLNRTSNLKLQFITILFCCTLNCLYLPADINITDGLLSPWLEKLILALIWSLFAFFYYTLNGVEGILSIQSLSICLGTVLMFAIGIMPQIDGAYSLIFTALFIGISYFTRYPAALTLNDSSCMILGLLIGWLGILSAIEGSGSCFIILSMYYIYETLTALLKKLNFQRQFKKMIHNTFYNQLASAGIAPQTIAELVAKINMIMILLAGFQIYAPNSYTMILISFFMVFWVTSKTLTPQEGNNHLLLSGNLLSFLRSSPKQKKSTISNADKDE